jgi:flavin-dependent dehydrogenase
MPSSTAHSKLSVRVAIAGGGPAGCAVAIGLARLGIEVALISRPRRRRATEGLSARTLGALESLKFRNALATLGPKVLRQCHWNGIDSSSSSEWLVDRGRFDQALLEDAAAAGVRIISGKVTAIHPLHPGWTLTWQADQDGKFSDNLRADFLVEARGREAPRAKQSIISGPRALAIGRQWHLAKPRNDSRIAALPSGWAWLSAMGNKAQLQCITGRPGVKKLQQCYHRLLQQIPAIETWLAGATPCSAVTACGAHISAVNDPLGSHWIRVGDAALAPDPLSGQGVFEAIAAALAAVPTINTLLHRPEDASLAETFYRQRCRERFFGIARSGRDFYRSEQRYATGAFWQARQTWPDRHPTHPNLKPDTTRVQQRPVVIDGFIRAREVLVSPDQPRGVWKLNQVPMVPLLHYLQSGGRDGSQHFQLPEGTITTAQRWLQDRGLL